MVAIFFPVNILKTLIDLSFNITAMYFPFWLTFKLKGIEFADNNFKNYVSILQEYFNPEGKSNVYGSHTYKNALSSIEKHISWFQSIFIAFIGCLWKFNVLITYDPCSS